MVRQVIGERAVPTVPADHHRGPLVNEDSRVVVTPGRGGDVLLQLADVDRMASVTTPPAEAIENDPHGCAGQRRGEF
jgi:hypothetical protein